MAYMAECVIALDHTRAAGMPARSLMVQKYRGSTHAESRVPLLIGAQGIELDPLRAFSDGYRIYTQRVSTGVERLDNMLGGGLIRGSTTLLTGAPGTSKTTLAGKFAEAACARGGRVLFVCFDEAGNEIVRNLASVGIRLGRFVKSGLLRMFGMVSRARSAEAQVADILRQIDAHRPRALVLDPLSALAQQGGESGALDITYRIVQQCKMRGITVFATSLVSKETPDAETTKLNVSTLADTWIHLSYLVRAGERNRALTIVKSRGTGHTNQVRELILGDRTVTLADAYVEEGEVLMGTMRYQREMSAARKRKLDGETQSRERLEKEQAVDDLSARIRTQQKDLERLTRGMSLDAEQRQRATAQRAEVRSRTSRLRRADSPAARRKKP
jgi:circadian clock protein KaiC